MRWTFAEKSRYMANRDPVEAEFFREGRLVQAVVRESIQNSLDATSGAENPVRVRFSVPNRDSPSVPAARAAEWFEGYEDHLRASGLGKPDLLAKAAPCFVVEDFHTRGLDGPVDAADDDDFDKGIDAGFFYFWRNVGRTGKATGKRGSWGLGKAVYAMASRVRCKFGLTIRQSDNKAYLMGQSELKIHRIKKSGDVRKHIPDGWFGNPAPDKFVLPTSDSKTIARFRKCFGLTRKKESGLSLVVPFPHGELEGQGGTDAVLREVVRQYVFPIMSGQLEVDVHCASRSKTWRIRKDTLESLIKELNWKDQHEEDSIHQLLDLATYVMERSGKKPDAEYACANRNRADWSDLSLDAEKIDQVKRNLLSHDLVQLRVPVGVKREGRKKSASSHFDVYLHKVAGQTTGNVHFVRQGLLITEVAVRTGYGIVGAVIVDDGPLAGLLRAAENPAHTKWLAGSDRLRTEYTGGRSRVSLVKGAPKRIIRDFFESDSETDYDILSDLFPDGEPGKGAGGGKKEKKKKTPGKVYPPPPTPKVVRFEKTAAGFSAAAGPAFGHDGSQMTIEMAYDIARGNPFRKWERFDFTADQLEVQAHLCKVVSAAGNRIEFIPAGADFRLDVSGFGTTRDLIVRLR